MTDRGRPRGKTARDIIRDVEENGADTYEALGDRYGVSRERVRQIIKRQWPNYDPRGARVRMRASALSRMIDKLDRDGVPIYKKLLREMTGWDHSTMTNLFDQRPDLVEKLSKMPKRSRRDTSGGTVGPAIVRHILKCPDATTDEIMKATGIKSTASIHTLSSAARLVMRVMLEDYKDKKRKRRKHTK